MTGKKWRLWLALAMPAAAVWTALSGGVAHMAEQNRTFYAGAAAAPVNPPIGSFIAGDARNRRFTGVKDDIYAKAAVFHDGNTSVALVIVDCIGLMYSTIDEIRQAAAARVTTIPLPADHIVVASTHAHSGPDVVGIWGPDEMHSGVDPTYMARLVDIAADQVKRAADAMQPASMRYTTAEYQGEWVENICEPGVLDRALTTLQCVGEDGENIVTLTNFACHPTVFDAVYSVVSSDYIGGFYRAMHAALPGDHLFIQGALGGWVQPDKADRDFALADTYGGDLARIVLAGLNDPKPLDESTIRIASKDVVFPVDNEGWKQLSAAGVIDRDVGDTVTTKVVWFALGPAQFATHPGETAPAHSLATKAMMQTEPKFVIGLGMDAFGYILKPEYFTNPDIKHAEYLTGMSLGAQTASIMMKALDDIIPSD